MPGNARDIRAGGAFYEVYAKDGVSGVLAKIQGKVRNFGQMLQQVGRTGLTTGIAGANPLGLIFGAANRGAEIDKLAQHFQAPISVLNKLKYAADVAGVSLEEVITNQTGRFTKLINEAPGVAANQVQAATTAHQEYRKAIIALENAMLPLVSIIAPLIQMTSQWVRANAGAVAVIALLSAGVIALGASIALLGTPMTLAIAAGTALAIVFRGELTEALSGFGEIFKTTWDGITAAIKSGNLEAALEIATAGLKAIWAETLLALAKGWNQFTRWLVEWLSRNPWILPAIGGAVGFAVGGPAGALAGAAAGGAGALALRQWKDSIIKGLEIDLQGLTNGANAARHRLDKATEKAIKDAATPPPGADPNRYRRLAGIYSEVKGGFNVASAQQQFGYGQAATNNELTRQIAENTKKMAVDIAQIGARLVLQ